MRIMAACLSAMRQYKDAQLVACSTTFASFCACNRTLEGILRGDTACLETACYEECLHIPYDPGTASRNGVTAMNRNTTAPEEAVWTPQMDRRYLLGSLIATLACTGSAHTALAQEHGGTTPEQGQPGPLTRDKAQPLFPPSVFFAGRVAPVQQRNTCGAKLPHGLMLAGLVDTSGYSSGVQERYQAYLLLDTPVSFGGKQLRPGAYGCGVVGTQFLVLDLGNEELLNSPARHDESLSRPVPLQVVADSTAGTYRLYFGRTYVTFGGAQS